GAGRWYFFRRVTFPLLMPTTLFVLINAVINSFRLVDHIVVMTKGGPDNATALLLYYIYDVGFKFWDAGYAAALTLVLLVILATSAVGISLCLDPGVHYRWPASAAAPNPPPRGSSASSGPCPSPPRSGRPSTRHSSPRASSSGLRSPCRTSPRRGTRRPSPATSSTPRSSSS